MWRSRHSAGEGNLICFPVSHVYFFVEGGKSLSKLVEGHGRICPPLDLPLVIEELERDGSGRVMAKQRQICRIQKGILF